MCHFNFYDSFTFYTNLTSPQIECHHQARQTFLQVISNRGLGCITARTKQFSSLLSSVCFKSTFRHLYSFVFYCFNKDKTSLAGVAGQLPQKQQFEIGLSHSKS